MLLGGNILSLLEDAKITDYKGVYYKEIDNDICYIIRFTVDGKTKTKIIGRESEKITPFLAFKIKLDQIASLQLENSNKKKGITVSQYDFLNLYMEFFKHRKPYLSANTNKNYKSHYSKYFKYRFETTQVQMITKKELQEYINGLLEIKRPATVEKIKNTLNQFFKYLTEMGIVSYNPASSLILPKYDNKKYFTLPKKDVKRLFHYILTLDCLKTKAIYMFLIHGRRITETLSLKVRNIDFKSGLYKLESNDVKTRKVKFWKLEPFQREIVNDYFKSFIGEKEPIYLFENSRLKRPIQYTTFHKRHRWLRDDLELHDFTLHKFRHLLGFLMINEGLPLEVIAKVLGHSSIVSTQRYSEMKIDVATKSYRKIIKQFL